MATPQQFVTQHTWDTVDSADSVEWCPIAPYQNILVCGTYQLAEAQNSKRHGHLYLLSIGASVGLKLLQTMEMPAVLDTKWCTHPVGRRILLAVADAEGRVSIYCFGSKDEDEEMEYCQLSLLCQCSIHTEDDITETLALSLDWSTGKDECQEPMIAVSDSKGFVTLLQLTDGCLKQNLRWKAHDYEAWITAFDYWKPSVVYTGGDDHKLKVYDTRASPVQSTFCSKEHGAGVTSLHCNAVQENVFVSGSYDESVRIWDIRQMRQPTFSTHTGGGVWRLKWDPHRWQHILAACMHNGFHVLNKTKIVASYNEHGSLAYGADWCRLTGKNALACLQDKTLEGNIHIIGSCSFYDHKLCISAVRSNRFFHDENI